MSPQDVAKAFSIFFNLNDGQCPERDSSKRYLSKIKTMFQDESAAEELLKKDDPLVYEFYELGIPEHIGDLAFGTSITYPGKVGNEYYLTKGHFHRVLDTAEVYYCISGKGYMLMENPEGDWDYQELTPGKVVYVPKEWAHRSINIGNEPFTTFYVFRADAGHDYKTIETKGFRKRVIEMDGKPEIVDNPKWNQNA